jgi:hypothetical protein
MVRHQIFLVLFGSGKEWIGTRAVIFKHGNCVIVEEHDSKVGVFSAQLRDWLEKLQIGSVTYREAIEAPIEN